MIAAVQVLLDTLGGNHHRKVAVDHHFAVRIVTFSDFPLVQLIRNGITLHALLLPECLRTAVVRVNAVIEPDILFHSHLFQKRKAFEIADQKTAKTDLLQTAERVAVFLQIAFTHNVRQHQINLFSQFFRLQDAFFRLLFEDFPFEASHAGVDRRDLRNLEQRIPLGSRLGRCGQLHFLFCPAFLVRFSRCFCFLFRLFRCFSAVWLCHLFHQLVRNASPQLV